MHASTESYRRQALAELELRRRRAQRRAQEIGLTEFVREAWHAVEPETELVWGWHIDAICEHLEAVTEGRIKRLMVNVPPGHMKSMLVSVFWPAWMWLRAPHMRIFSGAYTDDLARRDTVRARDVIRSPWYQRTFRPSWILKKDQNVKSYYRNSRYGERKSFGVSGQITGFRGDGVIIDDPLNAMDALSETARERAARVCTKVLRTRLNRPEDGWMVCIMQRLHEADPAGVMLEGGGWEHLNLMTEFEPSTASHTAIGWRDPRTEPGELLFPAMFTRPVVDDLKGPGGLGTRDFEAQHQQRPSPDDGQIFRREWFGQRWRELPSDIDEWALSIDCSFKQTSTSDRVCIQVWARRGGRFYLIDQVVDRMGFVATIQAIRDVLVRYPQVTLKLVEDKANGSAVIDQLRAEIPGIVAYAPNASKEARAHAASPAFEAGNVWLPASAAEWLPEWIEQHVGFPFRRYDDEVDATTQILLRWLQQRSTGLGYWDGAL